MRWPMITITRWMNVTILPIAARELEAAAREREGGRLHWERSLFAGMLLAAILGTFGAWCYVSSGYLTHWMMRRGVTDAARWCGLLHFAIAASILLRGAWSITRERDRRTLESLLISPMTNAEIVLGKLASCLIMVFATFAAGLPVVLLLHVLGGIDLRVIVLCYVASASSIVFLSALAIWISAEAPDVRWAYAVFLLAILAWAIGPFSLAHVLPRSGVRLPEWIAAANSWLVSGSPINLAFHLATGVNSYAQLSAVVGRMIALQSLGAVLLTIGAIARLRSAHRALASRNQGAPDAQERCPVWRFWRRPPVGDNPILWREMYTSRGSGLMKAVGVLVNLCLMAALAAATYYFAKPAVVEVWRYGYRSGMTTSERPEFNLFVRMFVPSGGANQPVDLARTDFNLFVRFVTLLITALLIFGIAGNASQTITLERRKETWTSLLATPMTARAILRSALLVTLWRTRQLIAILGVLWTLGLLAGAIHPVGFLLAMFNLGASAWLFAVWGLRAAVRAQDQAATANDGANLPFLSLFFLALPFLLPARFYSVLLGAGSFVFVGWMSLVSYRDVRAAVQYAVYPPLAWLGIATGEGPLWVLAACVLGTVAPAVGGWWTWQDTVANFDRLVGRPWRASARARGGRA